MHEFGDVCCLHPIHDARAMKLDRLLDNAKVERDLLAAPARRDGGQYFALARREAGETLPKRFGIGQRVPLRLILPDGGVYRGHERLCPYWLGQEVGRPGFNRAD